jgi:hypothetical protein
MREFLAISSFGPQKAREASLLGIRKEGEWWDSGLHSGISYAIAHSLQVTTGLSGSETPKAKWFSWGGGEV